jgi:hypothetical protein
MLYALLWYHRDGLSNILKDLFARVRRQRTIKYCCKRPLLAPHFQLVHSIPVLGSITITWLEVDPMNFEMLSNWISKRLSKAG